MRDSQRVDRLPRGVLIYIIMYWCLYYFDVEHFSEWRIIFEVYFATRQLVETIFFVRKMRRSSCLVVFLDLKFNVFSKLNYILKNIHSWIFAKKHSFKSGHYWTQSGHSSLRSEAPSGARNNDIYGENGSASFPCDENSMKRLLT